MVMDTMVGFILASFNFSCHIITILANSNIPIIYLVINISNIQCQGMIGIPNKLTLSGIVGHRMSP